MIRNIILAACLLMASPANAGCGFLGLFGCSNHHSHHPLRHHRHHHHTRVIVKRITVVRHVTAKKAATVVNVPEEPPIQPIK